MLFLATTHFRRGQYHLLYSTICSYMSSSAIRPIPLTMSPALDSDGPLI